MATVMILALVFLSCLVPTWCAQSLIVCAVALKEDQKTIGETFGFFVGETRKGYFLLRPIDIPVGATLPSERKLWTSVW